MARIVFGMNVSLDGYVDHENHAPDAVLFDHWIDHVRDLAGSVYGRRMYEIMRYWDRDDPAWSDAERAFAAAWRALPKWVVSGTLTSVGPGATLVGGDAGSLVRDLKSRMDGEISVAGPCLAQSLTEQGLIDAYRLYFHPVVLGGGTPFFAGPRPRLHLAETMRIGADIIRLTYVPA